MSDIKGYYLSLCGHSENLNQNLHVFRVIDDIAFQELFLFEVRRDFLSIGSIFGLNRLYNGLMDRICANISTLRQ